MRETIRKLYRAIPFKQPAFELLRRCIPLPERVYRHLYFRGVIRVPFPGGSFRMRHHGYQIENELFWSGLFGGWEGPSLRFWMRAARGSGVVLDVGANTGLYALAAQAANPRATVVAFEPVVRIHEKLEANVALNAFDIETPRIALSDRDGTGILYDTPYEHELSATLARAWSAESGRAETTVEVPLHRLDTLVARGRVPLPDLIKIDVEGHELAVLEGMADTLTTSRPTLLIEVLSEASAAGIDALARARGYRIFRLDPHGPVELDRAAPAPGTNLVLCRDALVDTQVLE